MLGPTEPLQDTLPGFFVNTVGWDEEAIRNYIRHQEKEDQRLEQLNLWR